jgi:hypothetical protein
VQDTRSLRVVWLAIDLQPAYRAESGAQTVKSGRVACYELASWASRNQYTLLVTMNLDPAAALARGAKAATPGS